MAIRVIFGTGGSKLFRTSLRNLSTGTQVLGYEHYISPAIQTSKFQNAVLAVGTGIGSLVNPMRADFISVFGETSGLTALKMMRRRMLGDPYGKRILADKPILRTHTISLDSLKSLPDNTFGKAYSNFLNFYSYTPDARMPVQFVEEDELAYVLLRYREIHDLVHVLLGQPTNMLGEVVVKWAEGLQTGLPLCVLGGFFGALRLAPKQRKRYLNEHLRFAIHVGLNSRFLMNVYYEECWEMDIDHLRRVLNIPSPPKIKK